MEDIMSNTYRFSSYRQLADYKWEKVSRKLL